MQALTPEAIQAILPVLRKDATARKALQVYAGGKGTAVGLALAVRYHAARIYDEGDPELLTAKEQIQLMRFLATYGRPGNAAKTGEARVEKFTIQVTPTELGLLKDAAGKKPAGTYAYEAVMQRVYKDLGLDYGI